MTTPIAPLDFSGVIPPEFSTQIIEEAVQQSAVLQLATLVPMGTGIAEMPVPSSLPVAAWVTAPGGRKQYTSLGLTTQTLHAEEVAAITAIPDAYLEDSSINLWAWVRPRLAEAIAIAIDQAILFGVNAPATFPTGGVVAATWCQNVATAYDAVDGVNQAMSLVESEGLPVTGHAADLTVKGILRGVRSNTGELLFGEDQTRDGTLFQTLYSEPITYTNFTTVPTPNFITGDWRYLIVGVRQDIRYVMDPSAVVVDNTGAVVINGFQDNTTPLKVWARFACQIVKPVTVREPAGASPFAKASLTAWTGPSGSTGAGTGTGTGTSGSTVTVTNPGNQNSAIGTAITAVQVAATTSGTGATITNYAATGLPAGLSIAAATGRITGTPTAPAGTANVTVTVTDSTNAVGTTQFTWTTA